MTRRHGLLRKTVVIALAAAFPLVVPPLASLPLGGAAWAQSAPLQPKEGWYKHLVDTDFVKERAQIPPRKDVTIIDARPAARQYERGHIPGAINIPDSKFEQMTALLPADKAQLVILYCGGLECMLSHNMAHKMEKMGYTNLKVYAEGFPAWVKAYPDAVAMPAAAKPAVEIAAGKDKGSISLASFEKLYKETPEAMLLVDVRDAKEYAAGTLKGAINIPIGQLEKRIEELPKGKPVVFFCGTGARAGEGYDTVKLLRPEVLAYFLDVEMKINGDGTFLVSKAR